MRAFLLFVFLGSVLTAGAQTGNIRGNVKSSDGLPADLVTVALKNTKKGTNTNRDGQFEIKNIQPGNYTLVVSYVGLESKEQRIEVKAGETTRIADIVLAENAQQLKDVVISVSKEQYTTDRVSSSLRLSTPLIETPQNIQVVTQDVLKDQQVISMSDGLIRNVSGLTRAEHWGDLYTNVSARGSQIQAFRNGFNVVNSYWGPLTEDMSFVEAVEFVKGPAGFMLSSGDPSGLYNVVTKKPTGYTRGEASFTAGSVGLVRTTLDLDGKFDRASKLLYRINLSGQNKSSHRANEYNDRYAIAPVISYQLDESTRLTFEYNYQRANMSNVGSFYLFSPEGFEKLPVDFTMMPAGAEGTKINDHSMYVNLRHDLNENWKVTAQVAHFIYDQVGSSMWPTSVFEDGTVIRNIGIWDARSKMTMAQLFANGEVTTGTVRHRILSGVDMGSKEYMADWGQSHDLDSASNPFDPRNPNLGVPITGYPKFDRTTPLEERAQAGGGLQDQQYTSIYLQDELGLFDNRIRLTLAGRFTDLQQSAWGAAADKANHFTPRVGLSGSLNKRLSAYALYDQAFVPQTGIKTDGGKVQPITGNNMELGIKKDWNGGWTTTLSAYRILKNNELTADPSDPLSGMSIELGQKTSKGVEFDLRGTIVDGLNLIANYAYTDSRISKLANGVTELDGVAIEVGSIVPGFAKHTVNTWLTYRIQDGALKGIGISAGYTALLDRATYWEASPDPEKEMTNYFKLDAGLFWERNRIKLTVNVFNVLDEYLYSGSYESWTSPATTYCWQTEAPRNARFSIAYSF